MIVLALFCAVSVGAADENRKSGLNAFQSAAAHAVKAHNSGDFAGNLSIHDFRPIAEQIDSSFDFSQKDIKDRARNMSQGIMREIGGPPPGEFAHGARLLKLSPGRTNRASKYLK